MALQLRNDITNYCRMPMAQYPGLGVRRAFRVDDLADYHGRDFR